MWVVDTCVLIDIADDDLDFGQLSATCLARHLDAGLTLSPVSYVELAPVFDGSRRLLDTFLDGLGVSHDEPFRLEDRDAAFSAWKKHIQEKRAGAAPRRPVADALIGALAMRRSGLITRNVRDFRYFYPKISIVDPTAS